MCIFVRPPILFLHFLTALFFLQIKVSINIYLPNPFIICGLYIQNPLAKLSSGYFMEHLIQVSCFVPNFWGVQTNFAQNIILINKHIL